MRTISFIPLFLVASAGQGSIGYAADDFESLMRRGRAALAGGDPRAAEESYSKACPPDLPATWHPANIAACEHHLATLDEAFGRISNAEQRYQRASQAWERSGADYLPSHTATLMNLGELYRNHHRAEDAEKILLRAVEFARRTEKEYPQEIPEALSRLGGLYSESDEPERGRPLLAEALDRFRKLTNPVPAELAYAYNALGMVDLTTGHYTEGESNLRQAVALATATLGEDHPETANYETNLALGLILRGQMDRAETLLRRARFVIEKRLGPSDKRIGTILAELSTAESGQKKFALAEDYAQQAIAVMKKQPEPDRLGIALANVNLATVYLRQRKAEDAAKILPDAISEERRFLPRGRVLADGIRYLAELRVLQHSWQEADSLYLEAIRLYEDKLGTNNPEIAPVLREYADVRKHNGASKAEVKTLEARAKAILTFAPGG